MISNNYYLFPLLIYLPTFNWVPCHQSFLNVTFSKLHCRKTNVRIPVRRFLVPSPTSRMHKLQGCHIDSCQHFQDKLCSQNWERIEKQGKIKDTRTEKAPTLLKSILLIVPIYGESRNPAKSTWAFEDFWIRNNIHSIYRCFKEQCLK